MTIRPRTVGFLPGERNVFFHILTGCNLSCAHCYINKEQHGANTLTDETMHEWIDLFTDPRKKSNMIFLGGEPTMHKGLAAGIEHAKKNDFVVTVDTNGFLFNDILAKTSPDLLDYLSFSLDGPSAEINDPIRGKGVFDVCTENIRRAVGLGYKVSVIYTLSRKNIDHLHKMAELLMTLGVKKFFIQVIGLRGNSAQSGGDVNDDGEWQVSSQRWLDIVPKTASKIAEYGIHVTYPKVFLEEEEQFQCAGLVAENYFVFPNGRVYQCPLCEDHPIHAYTIKDGKLVRREGLTEQKFFTLDIPEGCVMNKLLQPGNIEYLPSGKPKNRISCCLLKQEVGW